MTGAASLTLPHRTQIWGDRQGQNHGACGVSGWWALPDGWRKPCRLLEVGQTLTGGAGPARNLLELDAVVMSPDEFRCDIARSMYQSQRDRRDQVRNGVATPVAALAFSVFNLSTLATQFSAQSWADPVTLVIALAGVLSVGCLIAGSAYIVRAEWNVIYLDPPDAQEMKRMEDAIRERCATSDEDVIVAQMRAVMTAAYDTVYRRYFSANEQASADRTRALRLIVVALVLLSGAFLFLPFQAN